MKTEAVNKCVKLRFLIVFVWTFKPTGEDVLVFDLSI